MFCDHFYQQWMRPKTLLHLHLYWTGVGWFRQACTGIDTCGQVQTGVYGVQVCIIDCI